MFVKLTGYYYNAPIWINPYKVSAVTKAPEDKATSVMYSPTDYDMVVEPPEQVVELFYLATQKARGIES